MNILIILGHPSPKSLNHALAFNLIKVLTGSYQIVFHDLYAEKFDPLLKEDELLHENIFHDDIAMYCRELQQADCLIIIHPNWWGRPPAILKGWIGRVIRLGVGYGFEDNGEGLPVTLLKLKYFFVFNTSNTIKEREQDVFHDPLNFIWKNCIADFLGVEYFYREMFSVVITSSNDDRESWINNCCKKIEETLSLSKQ
jgi:NAD(P)H dehydrogenase (quinone)